MVKLAQDLPQVPASSTQREWYKSVQKGSDIPLGGLRKPQPTPPKGKWVWMFWRNYIIYNTDVLSEKTNLSTFHLFPQYIQLVRAPVFSLVVLMTSIFRVRFRYNVNMINWLHLFMREHNLTWLYLNTSADTYKFLESQNLALERDYEDLKAMRQRKEQELEKFREEAQIKRKIQDEVNRRTSMRKQRGKHKQKKTSTACIHFPIEILTSITTIGLSCNLHRWIRRCGVIRTRSFRRANLLCPATATTDLPMRLSTSLLTIRRS